MQHFSGRVRSGFFALVICAAAFGCAGEYEPESGAGEDGLSQAEDELGSETVAGGTALVTTTSVNFREAASTGSDILRVLSARTDLVATGSRSNGFYGVTRGTETGWVHGAYLARKTSTSVGSVVDSFVSRGTGYYPANNAMEGGYVDRKGARLRTLQQYLAGNAEYVSVAMDSSAFAYGTKLRITEFEERYGRSIEFRVVDTGGAFQGKGRSRMDICVSTRGDSLDSTVNGTLHVKVVR